MNAPFVVCYNYKLGVDPTYLLDKKGGNFFHLKGNNEIDKLGKKKKKEQCDSRSPLPTLACKWGGGEEEEWEEQSMYQFYRFKQSIS